MIKIAICLMLAGCATAQRAPAAAITSVIDCTKADRTAIERLALEFATDVARQLLRLQPVDWADLVTRAWAQGRVTGGCAFAEFVARLKAPAPATAEVQASDVTATARAAPTPAELALEELRARAGGVHWQTASGVR